MKPNPRISVVIATYNRRTLLARTLPTVTTQDLNPALYEVIVVSDGSTDGTVDFLKSHRPQCEFRIVEQHPNQGQARAANAGAHSARGTYVLFLDDDIVCDVGLLRAHLEAHQSQESESLVFGPVLVSGESPKTLATDWTRWHTKQSTERLAREGVPRWPDDATVDANSSLPRSVFLESGGFDESFLSARQNEDLGRRLWHGGLPFVYAPNAPVHQIFVKSDRAVALADATEYGGAEIRMMRKLPYSRSASSLASMIHAPLPKRLLHRVVTGLPFSPEPLLRPCCAIARVLRGVPLVRDLGPRILNSRRSVVFHRAAIREAGGVRAAKAEFGVVLPVLMYHHIGPRIPGTFPELTVSPAEFEAHLKLLKRRGYTSVAAADWQAYVEEGRPLPVKPVLLTFDDAYADLAQYGLPLMEKYRFTGLVFVPTSFIGNTNLWDQANGSAPHSMMTREQIVEWAGRGIEFGSHTRSHPYLQQLDPNALDDELERSGRDLAAILGRPITTFAYPYGEYGEREVKHSLFFYSSSFTTDEGTNNLTTNLGRLRRIMVYPDGLLMLRVSLALGLQPIRWLRERVRLRTRMRRQWNHLLGRPDTSRFGTDRPSTKPSPETSSAIDSSMGDRKRSEVYPG